MALSPRHPCRQDVALRGEAAAALLPLPEVPGAYRFYYADVIAGDTTAVFLLMLGSLRCNPPAPARGLPLQHGAVHFALYRRGVRQQWVFSQYTGAGADACSLRIGNSRLHYRQDGTVDFFVRARCAPFGRVTKAALTLWPKAPGLPPHPLVEGLSHRWTLLVPRARATLRLPLLGEVLEGVGYHDSNAGEVPLGTDLPGWTWTRVHTEDATHVHYQLPDGQALCVSATDREARLVRQQDTPWPSARTGWGLVVPLALRAGPECLRSPRVIESSPFFARLQAASGTAQALGEVADFRRFHSPLVRWMAHLRTRVERAA